MTYRQTTITRTATETAPQSCDDDPCGLDDIPDFLQRTPGDAWLANLTCFAASHGFRIEPMSGGIVVVIPWAHRNGSTGETGHPVRTMAELRDALGY